MSTQSYYVYIHKKKTTGEIFYVGKGSGNRYRYANSRNSKWKAIVKKSGFIPVIICDNIRKEYDAFKIEAHYVKLLCTERLANCSPGGGGGVPPHKKEQVRRKLSEHMKRNNPTRRPEVREKISKALTGRSRPYTGPSRKGFIMPDETKRKISEIISQMHRDGKYSYPMTEKRLASIERLKGKGNPFYGRKHTEDTKRRISEKKSGVQNPQSDKTVYCFVKGDQEVHMNIFDFTKFIGGTRGGVRRITKGERKSYRKWKLKNA